MDSMARPLAAEFIGTFALIFIGAGAGTVLGGGQMPGIAFCAWPHDHDYGCGIRRYQRRPHRCYSGMYADPARPYSSNYASPRFGIRA